MRRIELDGFDTGHGKQIGDSRASEAKALVILVGQQHMRRFFAAFLALLAS